MVPFAGFCAPSCFRHAFRRYHQHFVNHKPGVYRLVYRGQRDNSFAQSHIQEQPKAAVCYDTSGTVRLVIMRFIYHLCKSSLSCRMNRCTSSLPYSTITFCFSRAKRSTTTLCRADSFPVAVLTSANHVPPLGKHISLSGTPVQPGDTNLNAVPPSFLTSEVRSFSTSVSALPMRSEERRVGKECRS